MDGIVSEAMECHVRVEERRLPGLVQRHLLHDNYAHFIARLVEKVHANVAEAHLIVESVVHEPRHVGRRVGYVLEGIGQCHRHGAVCAHGLDGVGLGARVDLDVDPSPIPSNGSFALRSRTCMQSRGFAATRKYHQMSDRRVQPALAVT